MKQVASASNPLHARLLVGILEDHGIEAIIQGENLFYTRGELPFTPDSAPSVWVVQDDQAPRAMDLLARHDGGVNPAKCRQCGYELRGLTEARCPECGTPFRVSGEWTCAGCGETSPTQFTHCWSCGAAQEDGKDINPHTPRTLTRDETEWIGQPKPNCPRCLGSGFRRQLSFSAAFLGVAVLILAVLIRELDFPRFRYISTAAFLKAMPFLFFGGLCVFIAYKCRKWKCECSDDD